MKHTAVVAIRRLPCLHQAARRLATNYHEISGFKRFIFIMSQKSPLLFLSIVLGILLFAPWEAMGMLRYKGIASEVEGKGEGKNSYRQNDRGQIIDHETAESQSVKRGSLDNERGINTGVSEDIPEEEQERESLPLISFQMALAGHLYAERFFLTKTEYGNVELMAEEVASLEKSAQEISNENREVTRIFQAALEASAPGINFSDFFQTESMSSLESYPALSAEKIKQALTVYLKSNQNPLARIFYPSLLRKPGTPMAAALELNFDQDSMDSYSPDKNSSSALPHQPSRLSRRESDEISGLDNF